MSGFTQQNARWIIYGANSMVITVPKDALCLGFVDGGLNPRIYVVTDHGKQMDRRII